MNYPNMSPKKPTGQILWTTLGWFIIQSKLGQVATSWTTKGDLTFPIVYAIELVTTFAILIWWISGRRFENVPFNFRYPSALFLAWMALTSHFDGVASRYFGSPDLLKITDPKAAHAAIHADQAFQSKLINTQFLITIVGIFVILLFCLYMNKKPRMTGNLLG